MVEFCNCRVISKIVLQKCIAKKANKEDKIQ